MLCPEMKIFTIVIQHYVLSSAKIIIFCENIHGRSRLKGGYISDAILTLVAMVTDWAAVASIVPPLLFPPFVKSSQLGWPRCRLFVLFLKGGLFFLFSFSFVLFLSLLSMQGGRFALHRYLSMLY